MKRTYTEEEVRLMRLARREARRDERRCAAAEKLEAKRKERSGTFDPIYRGDKRKHVINALFDRIKDWRSSPFESEGPARAAFRAELCLIGFEWTRSDHEATSLVSQAVSRLCSKRPTYEQGQREYVIPAENCTWCNRPMDVTLNSASRRYRFCSEECATSSARYREAETSKAQSKMHTAALEVIRRAKKPTQKCLHCEQEFKPGATSKEGASKYCSRECQTAARTIFDKTKRPCRNCGKKFRPTTDRTQYCSRKCSQAYGYRPHLRTECQWCGGIFLAKFETAKFCCTSHRTRYSQMVTGRFVAKKLTAPVLDFVLREQGLRITRERMAA